VPSKEHRELKYSIIKRNLHKNLSFLTLACQCTGNCLVTGLSHQSVSCSLQTTNRLVQCLEAVVLVGHVNCPGKLVTLSLVVNLLNWHRPLLAPTLTQPLADSLTDECFLSTVIIVSTSVSLDSMALINLVSLLLYYH